jgi:hypothetical protein
MYLCIKIKHHLKIKNLLMKKSIVFICLVFPFVLIGQIQSSISGLAGMDYTYRLLRNSSTTPIVKDIFTDRQKEESGTFNYRIGINYNRRLSEKLWLETGLRLSSIGYNGPRRTGLIWGSELNPTTGVFTPDPTLPHQIQFNYDYIFLEIPVGIRYLLASKNKWKPYFIIGLSPNVYLTTRTHTITDIYNKKDFYASSEIKKITFSANIGFGFDYNLSEKYQIFAQPSFRYHFTNLSDGPIKEYLYNAGVELGFRKNLK